MLQRCLFLINYESVVRDIGEIKMLTWKQRNDTDIFIKRKSEEFFFIAITVEGHLSDENLNTIQQK